MTSQELKTYKGNCHCGAFQFTVKLPELKSGNGCDCSYCFKKNAIWVNPKGTDNFTVTKGEGSLKQYRFGEKKMIHEFCPICGTTVLALDPTAPEGEVEDVNARTLQDIDVWALNVNMVKGSDFKPPYQEPGPPPHNFTLAQDEGYKIYTGSCHCGAVKMALKSKPLQDLTAKQCNCSYCVRMGRVLVFQPPQMVEVFGEDHLTKYSFAYKNLAHYFCRECGVAICIEKVGDAMSVKPLNLRAMHGVDWDDLTIQNIEGKKFDPPYVVEH